MNAIVKKNGVTFGIISGLISILLTTFIYVINLEFFTKWWLGLLTIAISLTLSIILMVKTKKEVKDEFTFKNAFTTYFIYTLIGIFISVLFNVLLFNFIDPAAKETIKDLTLKFTVELMESFGTPREAINETIEKLQNQDQFGVLEQFKGMFFTIAISCVFGLILAAIFKTKRREEF
ncbi:DUF4199 domain-containing protein [Flavobacterium aquatile]|uniref:DUF4199 domain-containing protein n=1 Tax=Flavobacterium aquatile LMG 4008 = ATCC 11947 TaxID=1453498 RepID=A0A095U4T5_9FLAO|nr:DUF4199 domain-containing protein [Flavobacterium aquatile]KGD69643.1 hypothetical protein LG45_02490 [Flavobacterium aquatile LMG 4008 = ATCC 11947]OXA67217.1 DUF4199 domain-containing protein [Flavobacterium aquatile LMG 4008 = ATCC 11947]GEC77874.1 hypothetical protein FAQ01_07440 [Flavobacterium aquatile]